MGHLSIVNLNTLQNVINTGYISTRGDLKEKKVKTVSDLLSDVLATRYGDLVFPWIARGERTKNIGFQYIFRIDEQPIFVRGEKYPIKVPLNKKGLKFQIALSEAEALDLWDNKLLWNAIGKKSLGRGRSLTHQLPMEDERLIELLRKKNISKPEEIELGIPSLEGVVININPKQDKFDPNLKSLLESLPEEKRISELDLKGLPWRKGRHFICEKTLEAWLMANIDKEQLTDFRNLALLPDMDLEWFGNYLPFGVAGGNMDVVVIQSKKSKKALTVIELKVNSLNQSEYDAAAQQVVNYSNFLMRAFKAYGIDLELNNPVVLCGASGTKTKYPPFKQDGKTIRLFTYEIDDNGIVFFNNLV